MLCQFSFKNFLSYKDETVFDMQAASIPDLNESIIKCDKASDLLPVAAVYGPNGGGKFKKNKGSVRVPAICSVYSVSF